MKCEHCGAHIEETDKRCPYCNSYNENYKKPKPPTPAIIPKQSQSNNEENKNTDSKKEDLSFMLLFAIMLFLFVILFIAFLKSCSTCTSNKKGYADIEISKQVEITDDTITGGAKFQTSGKYSALK